MKAHNYRKYAKGLLLIVCIALQCVLSSCTTLKLSTAESVESGLSGISAKFVIIYKAKDSISWHLSNPLLFENKNTLYGSYDTLGAIGDMDKTNVIHLYITEFTLEEDGQVKIPLSSIFRVEYYKGSYGITTGAVVAGGVVVGATLVGLYLFFKILEGIGEEILLGIFGG